MTSTTSTLTVVMLKRLCKEKELSSTGRKAELVERLLRFGATREEVGLLETGAEDADDIVEDDEGALILESDGEEEGKSSQQVVMDDTESEPHSEEIFEAEVLEAEVLDAEIFEAIVVEDGAVVQVIAEKQASKSVAFTLDWRKNGAILLSFLLLGGAAWWWFSLEAEPFTPDPLRHGDQMGFAVTAGELVATEEFASKVFEWFGSDDVICRLDVDFSGSGSISIAEGDQSDISGEMNDDRLGSVRKRGGNGEAWLTMEKHLFYNFDEVEIAKSEESQIGCHQMPSVSAEVAIDWTEWVELSSENNIRSDFSYDLAHPDGQLQGDIVSFGLSGIIKSLDALGMGASMTFAPLQVHEVLGSTLIDEEAAGNVSGWSWRVTGSEEFGDEMAWKILFQNKDLEEHCLGHATIHVLVIPSSPWAVRQTSDLLISGDDGSDCGTWEEILGDYVMPDGKLEMRMTIEKTSLKRGEHLVDLGYSYDSKPDISSLRPPSSEMQDWGANGKHLPDNSTQRAQTLEMAVSCIDQVSSPGGGEVAMRDYDGYIWRAQDNRSQSGQTRWNLSWLANDDSSGWVLLDVAGSGGSSSNCTYIDSGVHDEAPDHNRKAIPETASMDWMETNRWLDADKFPEFSGSSGYAAAAGQWRSDLKLGILVATTGIDLPNDLDFLPLSEAGKATVDGIRSWEDGGWSHTFTFLADTTDAKLIGWSHMRSND